MVLTAATSRLSQDQKKVYNELYKHIELLTNLKYVYTHAGTTEKRKKIA